MQFFTELCIDMQFVTEVCCFFLNVTALAGNYVNFGVFELYGDRALADALDISLKMTLSIPLTDILAYRKVCDTMAKEKSKHISVYFLKMVCITTFVTFVSLSEITVLT